MPLGIQRLNAKRSQPNDRIVFIKPLKGPDEAVAQDFLERIAAQCLPVMKENHLSVMSLEEYEPNPEFVGRNFNAGEVVQLVLKARSGHWLPFNYVQMVMMHELAHCKQMNHSRAFWAVRNQYADQMRGLWSHSYTGEGLWGRGAHLSTGEWEKNGVQPGELLPEHLCGGTYRSRGRKRKAKKVLSYQEQKERRILKKFGANGVALGDDAGTKKKLEKGRTVAAKPRVAGSARGRELRAAAALARFDQQKKEPAEGGSLIKNGDESESSGDDYEDEELNAGELEAVDRNGKRLLDTKGRGMIKVCEDENPEDQDSKQELLELLGISANRPRSNPDQADYGGPAMPKEPETKRSSKQPPARKTPPATRQTAKSEPARPTQPEPKDAPPLIKSEDTGANTCSVCSFASDHMSGTCAMCANVLHPERMPGSWACSSEACKGASYRNARDCGVCGVCGERRREA
ncbi:WLM domain-containing protein [Lasiosphaeria miniovina]|uniref:WLM domain-containing protein n=1 Tax=Lasiosphaeria miniovina TaxID=1954250 RepID=A0AA40BFU5_9PEZI|nr:WLM domain-containing protein [Lasiosphaeria miniovina]KAK0733465.1 WLM domain-containing protein [Lasiosphaeria miniovina]